MAEDLSERIKQKLGFDPLEELAVLARDQDLSATERVNAVKKLLEFTTPKNEIKDTEINIFLIDFRSWKKDPEKAIAEAKATVKQNEEYDPLKATVKETKASKGFEEFEAPKEKNPVSRRKSYRKEKNGDFPDPFD